MATQKTLQADKIKQAIAKTAGKEKASTSTAKPADIAKTATSKKPATKKATPKATKKSNVTKLPQIMQYGIKPGYIRIKGRDYEVSEDYNQLAFETIHAVFTLFIKQHRPNTELIHEALYYIYHYVTPDIEADVIKENKHGKLILIPRDSSHVVALFIVCSCYYMAYLMDPEMLGDYIEVDGQNLTQEEWVKQFCEAGISSLEANNYRVVNIAKKLDEMSRSGKSGT